MYKNLTLALGMFSVFAVSSIARAQDGSSPDKNTIFIQEGKVSGGGTGCPLGSMQAFINPDGQAMTVVFDAYVAEIGGNSTGAEVRKFCNLNIGLNIPAGLTVAITDVEYRGFKILEPNVRARLTASYRFTGGAVESFAKENGVDKMRGPTQAGDEAFFIRDTFAVLAEARCGTNSLLNIKTAMQLLRPQGSKASGVIGTDTIDQRIETVFRLKKRACR